MNTRGSYKVPKQTNDLLDSSPFPKLSTNKEMIFPSLNFEYETAVLEFRLQFRS